MTKAELRANPMMRHLLDALERGDDIGEYGRRVVAVVGRYFLSEDELVALLTRNVGAGEARNLLREVHERGEYPPRRGKIIEYMKRQPFAIIPDLHDPALDDVYVGLNFPPGVAEHIPQFAPGEAGGAPERPPG